MKTSLSGWTQASKSEEGMDWSFWFSRISHTNLWQCNFYSSKTKSNNNFNDALMLLNMSHKNIQKEEFNATQGNMIQRNMDHEGHLKQSINVEGECPFSLQSSQRSSSCEPTTWSVIPILENPKDTNIPSNMAFGYKKSFATCSLRCYNVLILLAKTNIPRLELKTLQLHFWMKMTNLS